MSRLIRSAIVFSFCAAVALSGLASEAAHAATTPPAITSNTMTAWDIVQKGGYDTGGNAAADTAANTRTVSGTAEAAAGTQVDIYCVSPNDQKKPLVATATVDGSQHWTTDYGFKTVYDVISYGVVGCKFGAVWHGDPAPAYATLTTPLKRFVYFESVIASGTVIDKWVQFPGTETYADFGSAGTSALADMIPVNAAGDYGFPLWYFDAAVGGRMVEDYFGLQVDGHNAFMGGDIADLAAAVSPSLWKPTFSFTLNHSTGDVTFTETAKIFGCLHPDVEDDLRRAACTTDGDTHSVRDTGMRFNRVTTVLPSGAIYAVHDTYSSTDGQSHTFNARYQEAPTGDVALQFPEGSTGLPEAALVTGFDGKQWIRSGGRWHKQKIYVPADKPATVRAANTVASARSADSPLGTVTYGNHPDYFFGGTDSHFRAVYENRTVSNGTNFETTIVYTTGSSETQVNNLTDDVAGIIAGLPQADITWAPNTEVRWTATTLSALAHTTTGLDISYSVKSASTTGCTINSTTGRVTFTNTGYCMLTASVAGNGSYRGNSIDITLNVVNPPVAATCTAKLLGPVLFSSTKSDLTPKAKQTLDAYGAAVISAGCVRISVVGHTTKRTNAVGKRAARLVLARARAQSVKTYLTAYFAAHHFKVAISASGRVRKDSDPNDLTLAQVRAHSSADILTLG